jgi:hypothetical protein
LIWRPDLRRKFLSELLLAEVRRASQVAQTTTYEASDKKKVYCFTKKLLSNKNSPKI